MERESVISLLVKIIFIFSAVAMGIKKSIKNICQVIHFFDLSFRVILQKLSPCRSVLQGQKSSLDPLTIQLHCGMPGLASKIDVIFFVISFFIITTTYSFNLFFCSSFIVMIFNILSRFHLVLYLTVLYIIKNVILSY